MERVMEIARIILKTEKAVTSKQLAQQLKVSDKTVRNDLNKLRDIVEKEGLRLKRKARVGTTIEGADEDKIRMLEKIKYENRYIEPYSKEGRHNYILKRCFMDSNKVTVKELAEELYVCTATVNSDLKELETWLSSYKLRLNRRQNHKIEIRGSENDYRKAISNIILKNKDMGELREIIVDGYNGRIDYKSISRLKKLLDIDYSKLEELLEWVEEYLKFKFSQEAYISLIIHIAISIKRIKEGKDIVLAENILSNIKETSEFTCAKEMCKKMQQYFNILIPESEMGYITLHILGSKIYHADLGELDFFYDKEEEAEISVMIAKEIVLVVSSVLDMDLSKDKAFYNGLVLHLRPTINRLKYGLTLENPILDDIKANYPYIFGVAWMTSRVFKKYLDMKIPESEIGYIALHIGAAVERNKKQIKTLIVCHSGIGTSQLLSARIKRCFKEIEIVDIVASTKITDNLLHSCDLIISTVPITIERPVLVISPLFTQLDIRKVNKCIQKLNKGEYRKCCNKEIVSKEVFYRSKKIKSRDQLISDMCKYLEEKQYIKKSFRKAVLEREEIMPTEVGKSIAIPHGEPKDVKKSCIALSVLEHPLLWDKQKVEFVFMVCIAPEDLQKTKIFIRNLYKNMGDERFTEWLRKCNKDKDKVVKLLDELV